MIPRISLLVILGLTSGAGKGPSVRRESANRCAALPERVTATRRDGQRLMILLYFVIVGIAGGLGVVLGGFIFAGEGPELFFLIDLPATALGYATFGVVTVAIGLGIPLALVVYVSRGLDSVDKDT